MNTSDPVKAKAQADEEYIRRSSTSMVKFLDGLTIAGAAGPVRLGLAMADYQRQCFLDLAAAIEAVRDGRMPCKRRFWIERTKKGGKDSDCGACLLWPLLFPTRPIYMQVGAADREQAGIVKKRMEALIHYNPWMAKQVQIPQYHAKSSNGLATIDIMAADIAGAHGGTPDILLINELSHVTRWEFIENLLDNADGVPQGIVIIATNAGFTGTKAYKLRQVAEQDSDVWSMHVLDKPAPWIGEQDLAQAKKRNIPSRYKRLWEGVWVSGKGDALSDDMITRCFRHEGPMPRTPGWQYVAGLDLGVSHDHAGLCVLGVHQQDRRIRVARLKRWIPPIGGKIDLRQVRETCHDWAKEYTVQWFGYDPSQAVLMAQDLTGLGVPMREVPFSGNNLDRMATTLKETLEAGILEAYDDEQLSLQKDLGKLDIVEKPYGYRLTATSDEDGHADVATALCIVLPEAVRRLGGLTLAAERTMLYDVDLIKQDEYEEVPEELRSIYDTYDEMERELPSRRPKGYEL